MNAPAIQRPRRPARGAARALQRVGVVVPIDVLIQVARLDLLYPDAVSFRTVVELMDQHGPQHLALAQSSAI